MYFSHRHYSEDPIQYLWFYKIFSKMIVNIKINFNNLISSDLGNVCPKYTSGRTPFGNKLRRCTYNMYI